MRARRRRRRTRGFYGSSQLADADAVHPLADCDLRMLSIAGIAAIGAGTILPAHGVAGSPGRRYTCRDSATTNASLARLAGLAAGESCSSRQIRVPRFIRPTQNLQWRPTARQAISVYGRPRIPSQPCRSASGLANQSKTPPFPPRRIPGTASGNQIDDAIVRLEP